MKPCLFTLYFLGAWVFASLLKLPALPFFSTIFWLFLVWFGFRNRSQLQINESRWELVAPLFLMVYQSALSAFWLRDVWVLPSNDDTIAHLSYLRAILEQKNCLTGHVLKPGAEFFGEARYVFYPSGSHGIIALLIYPFWLLGVGLPLLTSLSMHLLLCLWPLALWFGVKKLRRDAPIGIRFFLVCSALTLPAFPLWPLGEGGLSRIFAMIFFTPIWFAALNRELRGFPFAAIFSPLLLFIHPSLLPFLGLSVLFFEKTQILRALLGAPIGALFFWLILKSGAQTVFSVGFVPEFSGWFDRLKGPFHYWFSDPYGFGKFLSPKNIPIFLGFFLVLFRKREPRILLLLFTPFMIAATSFVPLPGLPAIGLIFYHSVKRISELTPLLGISIASLVLNGRNTIDHARTRWLVPVSLAFLIVFTVKSGNGLSAYHSSYNTPLRSKVRLLSERLKPIPGDSLVINDDHTYDSLRFESSARILNLWTECQPVEHSTAYCKNRLAIQEILKAPSVALQLRDTEVWWIPGSAAPPANALAEITLDETRKAYRIK